VRSVAGVPFPTERGTLAMRLAPTLLHAKEQQAKFKLRGYYTNIAVTLAIGFQVLLGALTTGLSAALPGRRSSIATSIMGGILTVLASYLAKTRGTNEPEHSRARAKDFSNFIRDAEAVILDRGWLKNVRRLRVVVDVVRRLTIVFAETEAGRDRGGGAGRDRLRGRPLPPPVRGAHGCG
jgi:hypothetical protein